jgi:hypothetical protein
VLDGQQLTIMKYALARCILPFIVLLVGCTSSGKGQTPWPDGLERNEQDQCVTAVAGTDSDADADTDADADADADGQPTPPAGQFAVLGSGELHMCGLSLDGELACWGNNDTC